MCLKTPSWSELGISVEKKVTPEDVRPYPMLAPRVSSSFGRLKGNIKSWLTLTAEKRRIQELAGNRRPIGPSYPKSRKEVETCVTELYKNSDIFDSDFTSHETDEFTEECDCEDRAVCIAQPSEPNDFVLIKLATKKTVKYLVELI